MNMPWMHGNVTLFLAMHATDTSPAWLIAAAIFLAKWMLCVVLAITIWHLWHKRSGTGALQMIAAWAVSCGIEAAVDAFAFHPRPFAAGYGPAWVAHAANNSMPSSHVTLGLILVGILLVLKCRRSACLALVLTGVLAWSRIYIGIHWPIDMLGAAVSAALSVGAVHGLARLVVAWRKQAPKHGRSRLLS